MILNKPYTDHEYADLASYCNDNNCYIEDKGSYLESVKNPDPTIEELQENIRNIRNLYLKNTDKYMLIDFPITEEERQKYIQYRQYLRDYTNNIGWWKYEPKTFEEWNNTNES